MKALYSVHDYLLSVSEVGDWDGEEEIVADRINAIFHAVWDILPDDIESEHIEFLLPRLWDELRGDTVLLEAEEEELIDWAIIYVRNQLEEGMPELHTDDEEE
ncbi:hypothetical protein QE250_11590 [Chromatiaceae bacterium AAb-1]|nr:hypothetical protein [Chromatiaceae bacterium AAb-1]